MVDDREIAKKVKISPIEGIAKKLGIEAIDLEKYGMYKAKVSPGKILKGEDKKGKLIMVTAMTPTPAGEGKTTTSIGLADALSGLGKKAAVALREPSLGPVFGMKGGATGGVYAQVAPREEINLHFTGDIHAITAAHNLLSAMVDNRLHFDGVFVISTSPPRYCTTHPLYPPPLPREGEVFVREASPLFNSS